jgi:diguanylate cyclase (GGDEF)-like protein
MKIAGASESVSGLRRRQTVRDSDRPSAASTGAPVSDSKEFLGLTPAELTPKVQGALQTLTGEIDELRDEVGRLKARLAEVEGLADQDALTHVLNRRAFMRELNRVRASIDRYGGAACLVYIDLDGFKRINDRYGHAAGDAALKAVAERLSDHVRESDVIGRLGGDEFAVVLTHADFDAASAKAEALIHAVASTPIDFGIGQAAVSASFGIREISGSVDAEGLVAEADSAMYHRKRATQALAS